MKWTNNPLMLVNGFGIVVAIVLVLICIALMTAGCASAPTASICDRDATYIQTSYEPRFNVFYNGVEIAHGITYAEIVAKCGAR